MRKLSKRYLRKLIVEELAILKEEEDEGADIFGDTEEGGDEEEADDAGEDEAAAEDEGGDEEGGDDAEAEEGDEEESGGESEDKEDEEAATGPSDSGVDVELNSLLADFEAQALSIAQSEAPIDPVAEAFMPRLSSLLFEAEEAPPIDIPTYSNNVARLIQNYDALMDMEMMIFTKAREFLAAKYGEEVAVSFEESLEKDHGITFEPEEQDAPVYAVGAMNAQA